MENFGQSFWFVGNRNEAWSESIISCCSLSQDLLASTFSNEVIYDEEVSHTFHVAATLFHSNASSLNEEENIEEQSFSVSLEDTDDEKEVTDGVVIVIDDDSLTHSFFSVYSILNYEIYVPDPSHFVHNSIIYGV